MTVSERWTQERRREHTRTLLLDAAEEVFGEKGFDGASLDEIADRAGYTRGAIYKHFADKADLFLEVNSRFNERFLVGFDDVIDAAASSRQFDLAEIAKRWHTMQVPFERFYALGAEFNLYMLRNPEVRERVAAQQRRLVDAVASLMDEHSKRLDAHLRIPSRTLARIALASADGLAFAAYLEGDDEDLFEPFLELFMSAWEWDES